MNADAGRDIFGHIGQLRERLEAIHSGLRSSRRAREQPPLLERLVFEVRHLFAEQPDLCLGALHTVVEPNHAASHPIHCAFITLLMADSLGLAPEVRDPLTAAALTHDIGMNTMRPLLERQGKGLTSAQWQKVRWHTLEGVRTLEAAGITDTTWLDAVVHHHERLDGAGYPHGLSGDELQQGARICALADTYAALVCPRSYREGMQPVHALRELYLHQNRTLDPELTNHLIKELGVFPPGSLVRLANGEVAVVTARGGDAASARLRALAPEHGTFYREPPERDSREETHRIATPLAPTRFKQAAVAAYRVLRGIPVRT